MIAAQALREALTAASLLLAFPTAALIGCVIRGVRAALRERRRRL